MPSTAEPPQKKTKPSPDPPPEIPFLPDDIVFNCLVRVSRLYHPTLSLVSKSLRSLLTSPELYETRSLLGCTEHCLYVRFRVLPHGSPTWFTLCQRPKSMDNLLVSIPSFHSFPMMESAFVAVDWNMYVIGRFMEGVPVSSVWVLDCRTHSCRQAPSMTVARAKAVVGLVDGKIYVMGGCEARSMNWAEVFNLKTQTWELEPCIPNLEVREKMMPISEVVNGKVYVMASYRSVAYEPKEGRWDVVKASLDFGWTTIGSCVVDNILYCYHFSSKLRWYDSKESVWRVVKGLEKLPKVSLGDVVGLANRGGKLAVLWEWYVDWGNEIWCAEIALESRDMGEIWGTIEWSKVVLTVSREDKISHCLIVRV